MKNHTRLKIEIPDMLFFTADPHFFHDRIISLCGRPFKDADDMRESLIRNWNAVVPKGGSVFVLGDMFWKRGDIGKCAKVLERLNGRKWLVAGNHDLHTREDYLEMGFEDAKDYLELSVDHQDVVLSHYPLLEWNGFYHGSWHLHGHVHGRGSHFSFRVMDVGVDANNFTPVPWRDVMKRLDGGMELDEQAMRGRDFHDPYKF